jgi:hypothetical protein
MSRPRPNPPAQESPRPPSAWNDAGAAGVDLSLLEHSLGLSVWERLVEHQRALDLADMLQNAKIKPPCQT